MSDDILPSEEEESYKYPPTTEYDEFWMEQWQAHYNKQGDK